VPGPSPGCAGRGNVGTTPIWVRRAPRAIKFGFSVQGDTDRNLPAKPLVFTPGAATDLPTRGFPSRFGFCAKYLICLAPRAGFEPATIRLTVECSTAELPRNRAKQGSQRAAYNKAPEPCKGRNVTLWRDTAMARKIPALQRFPVFSTGQQGRPASSARDPAAHPGHEPTAKSTHSQTKLGETGFCQR
jgi:hypothetical protein